MSLSSERRSQSLNHAAHQLNLMNWPLVAVSALFLSFRIFLKVRQRRPLWWDDYVLIISWLALLLYAILFAIILHLGFASTDPTTIPPGNINAILVLTSALSSLLILANLWSKTSFGITLLRLPLGRARIYIICLLILLGTISIGASAYLVWIQCLIVSPPWSPYVGSHCLDPQVLISYSVFVGYFSALIDFSFVVLPWKMLWTMQMRRSEKVGITLAMGMGTLAGGAAIAKSTIFPKIYSVDDPTAGLQVSGWGAIETSVSIMAASIPILRALVRQGAAGQGGVPRGYAETESGRLGMREGTGLHSVRSTFFQRTFFAPSLASGSTRVGDVVLPEEGTGGKGKDKGEGKGDGDGVVDDGETARGSVEMGSYGPEARPRDFTV